MTLVVLWQASGKTDEHEMNDLYLYTVETVHRYLANTF